MIDKNITWLFKSIVNIAKQVKETTGDNCPSFIYETLFLIQLEGLGIETEKISRKGKISRFRKVRVDGKLIVGFNTQVKGKVSEDETIEMFIGHKECYIGLFLDFLIDDLEKIAIKIIWNNLN